MRFRLILASLLMVVVSSLGAFSQDESVSDASADNAPAAAAETVAPTSEAESTPAKEAYEKTFAEWKNILEEMRQLRAEADFVEEEKLTELQEKFNATVARGEEMLPKLRDAVIAAYEESPNTDKQIARWLSGMANHYVKNDRYDEAKKALDPLVAGKSPDPTVYTNAGIVAFVQNDYKTARAMLQRATNEGALGINDLAETFARTIGLYEEFWKEEEKAREKAANAEGEDRQPRVKLTTSKGEIILELFEDDAPDTVGNFVSLVEKGFYDELTFHRVLPGFVAQAGDPNGDGTGGPGYSIPCECTGSNYRKHFAGSISMAHRGRDTGGSQFFLTHVPTHHLNGKHTVFGRIVEGLDVLASLQHRAPEKNTDLLIEPDKINRAEVIFKRNHTYQPKKKE